MNNKSKDPADCETKSCNEGLECCGDNCYDPKTQQCCKGIPYYVCNLDEVCFGHGVCGAGEDQ